MLTFEASGPGELPRDQGRTYGISLKRGQYLHLVAEQHGADVALALIDPAELELFRVDSPIGNQKAEQIFFVAPATGIYRVKVEDGSRGKHSGKFHLRIEEIRRANDKDRLHVKAERAFYIGKRQERSGQLLEARRSFAQAIDIWGRLRNKARQADAFFRLGAIRLTSHDWNGAIEAYRRCADLRVEVRDQEGKAETLLGMALASEKSGRLGEAEGYFAQELDIRSRVGNDGDKKVSALYNLARIQQLRGKAEEALRNFNQVITACRSNGKAVLQSNALNGRGGVYASMGRSDLALDDFERALVLLDRTSSPRERASLLTQLAPLYARSGRTEKAIALIQEALKLRKEAHDLAGEGVTLTSLGEIYFQAERYDNARDAFQQAVGIFEAERDQEKQIRAMANLGVVHAIQDRPELALKILNEALPLARQGSNKPAEAALLYDIAYAESKKGNPITARARIDEAIEVMEALRSTTDRNDLRVAYFATREDLYGLKIRLLMQLHALRPRTGEDLEAFQTSERARARGLYEALANGRDGGGDKSAPVLSARYRAMRIDINKLDQQLRRPNLSAVERQVVEARLRELISGKEEAEARIHVRGHSAFDPDLLPSLSLWEIQNRMLDRGTLLLEYYVGEERSFLWAVTQTSFRSHELQCPDLRELTQRVYESLARSEPLPRHEQPKAEDIVRLSRCLIEPVADLLGKHRLLIVAHGALQRLPFSVLLEPATVAASGADHQPLVLRHELVHLPSVSVLAMLREQRSRRSRPTIFLSLVADPIYGLEDDRLPRDVALDAWRRSSPDEPEPYNFPRLRSSGEEAREIRALAQGRAVEMALGFQVTREWVLMGRLENAQVVHFAVHGVLNEDHPELSALVLSQIDPQGRRLGGFLRAHELENLRLKADLVVLSACQTALGKDVRGEGLVGLTQGFLAGGASSLLVSLWKVDDRATMQLMKYFYHALIAEREPPAAALRRAQLRMQRDRHWRDPYYWSGFVLQGDWGSREFSSLGSGTKSF
jgi:CHAT domain-containing protein/Flp pilus assembly protein TadD